MEKPRPSFHLGRRCLRNVQRKACHPAFSDRAFLSVRWLAVESLRGRLARTGGCFTLPNRLLARFWSLLGKLDESGRSRGDIRFRLRGRQAATDPHPSDSSNSVTCSAIWPGSGPWRGEREAGAACFHAREPGRGSARISQAGQRAPILTRGTAPARDDQSSALSPGSSPPFSKIFSAIRPELARICASILSATSGLAFRNVLAFSRPWPRRWLS